MEYFVIGDVAGEYETLLALINKMPKNSYILQVGDLVDRGNQSKEVVQWFMDNQDKAVSLLGNHCHMAIDYYTDGRPEYGDDCPWLYNGGDKTIKSYGGAIPADHLAFLRTRPLNKTLEIDGKVFYVSHTFRPDNDADAALPLNDNHGPLWNRYYPIRIPGVDLQVCGHNSQFSLKYFSDDLGVFAVCIDTSRHKTLTGIHLPSMKIYEQEYID